MEENDAPEDLKVVFWRPSLLLKDVFSYTYEDSWMSPRAKESYIYVLEDGVDVFLPGSCLI